MWRRKAAATCAGQLALGPLSVIIGLAAYLSRVTHTFRILECMRSHNGVHRQQQSIFQKAKLPASPRLTFACSLLPIFLFHPSSLIRVAYIAKGATYAAPAAGKSTETEGDDGAFVAARHMAPPKGHGTFVPLPRCCRRSYYSRR